MLDVDIYPVTVADFYQKQRRRKAKNRRFGKNRFFSPNFCTPLKLAGQERRNGLACHLAFQPEALRPLSDPDSKLFCVVPGHVPSTAYEVPGSLPLRAKACTPSQPPTTALANSRDLVKSCSVHRYVHNSVLFTSYPFRRLQNSTAMEVENMLLSKMRGESGDRVAVFA